MSLLPSLALPPVLVWRRPYPVTLSVSPEWREQLGLSAPQVLDSLKGMKCLYTNGKPAECLKCSPMLKFSKNATMELSETQEKYTLTTAVQCRSTRVHLKEPLILAFTIKDFTITSTPFHTKLRSSPAEKKLRSQQKTEPKQPSSSSTPQVAPSASSSSGSSPEVAVVPMNPSPLDFSIPTNPTIFVRVTMVASCVPKDFYVSVWESGVSTLFNHLQVRPFLKGTFLKASEDWNMMVTVASFLKPDEIPQAKYYGDTLELQLRSAYSLGPYLSEVMLCTNH